MRFTRRQTLLFGAAAGAAGLAGATLRGAGTGGVAAHALDVIRRVYGPEFADDDAAIEFAGVYERFVLAKGVSGRLLNACYRLGLDKLPLVHGRLAAIDESVIEKFATSTNVILAWETGVPLVFVALFHPYETPCVNQLSAHAIS
jgi:hypothetical protein